MIVRVPVRFNFGQAGNDAMNVWNVRTITDGEDGADMLHEALLSLKTFYTGMQAYLPSGTITLGEGMIRDPLGNPEYQDDDPQTITTNGGTSIAPPFLAVVISWRTTSASRSGRGRTFVGPWISSQMQADGTPAATLITSVKNHATDLLNDSRGPSGWSLGVLSQKQRVLRDITGFSVHDRWAYLSSRRD